MQRFNLLYYVILVTECAIGATSSQSMEKRRNIPKVDDTYVIRQGPSGLSLPLKDTIILFHIIQLEIVRETLQRGGDAVIPGDPANGWHRKYSDVSVTMRPVTLFETTWGEVLFGLQEVLTQMLDPTIIATFKEQIWVIGRGQQRTRAEDMTLVGQFAVRRALESLSLDNASSTPLFSNQSDNTPSSSGPLTVPYPVPDTDLTLLVGSPGPDLRRDYVIPALDRAIADLWRRVAIRGRAAALSKAEVVIETPDSTSKVTWRPSRSTESSTLFTEKEVVEMIVGAVRYFMQDGTFYATRITAARTRGRRRFAVGEMEFTIPVPKSNPLSLGNASNASLIQVS